MEGYFIDSLSEKTVFYGVSVSFFFFLEIRLNSVIKVVMNTNIFLVLLPIVLFV